MRLVCCLVLVLGGLQLACALKVAAWNIESFAQTKANKAGILDHIATVVRRYDVIVIQELKDRCTSGDKTVITAQKKDDKRTDLTVVNKLMKLLTEAQTQPGGKKRRVEPYKHIVSYPLGPCTSNYRERYLFIYKIATVTALDSCNYVVTGVNPFSRPPFSVKFHSKAAVSFDFVLVPLHAKPGSGDTYKEINALDDVVKKLPAAWNTKNVLLLGDFNAAPPYLPKKDQKLITLNEKKGYEWLIGDSVATNVAGTSPYDRIVATTDMNNKHVVSGSPMVYNFQTELGLDQTQAEAVSDHFPVEVELK